MLPSNTSVVYTYQSIGQNISTCIWIVEARSGTEWDFGLGAKKRRFFLLNWAKWAGSLQTARRASWCMWTFECVYIYIYNAELTLRSCRLGRTVGLFSVPPNGQFGPVYQSVKYFSTAVQILNRYTSDAFLFNQQKLQSAMAENRKSEERWKL